MPPTRQVPIKERCVNYINCGNRYRHPDTVWCEECDAGLSLHDKFYIIGYTGAWDLKPFHLTDEDMAPYYMGVADRMGDELWRKFA